jgi:tRNA(fMet)-specific endonuclease VapC
MYCFDTDTLSISIWPNPPAHLVRRLARVEPTDQCTTSVTVGELLYGVAKRGGPRISTRVRDLVRAVQTVVPFDVAAAEVYGPLRADLERAGRPLDERDLMIASICLARDLTLVTGNVRHFDRVPGLRVEYWLES